MFDDPLVLARAQFGLNIAFHILFPAISIALAWYLVYFRIRYARSADARWLATYKLWLKVFALSFAMGVVSGIVMSFQFGTNWPGFMEKAGNIAGPLLGYEILTAFFLEASFLGVMLFGKHRVSNRTHLVATTLVAIGTTASAFWIISLNSWMQTPTGHVVRDGVFYVESWSAVIFNPSFPYRLSHMLVACLLTAAFLLMGVSAWRFIDRIDGPATLKVFRTGLVMAMVCAPLQAFIGDLHGLNTLEHQPAKIAAMEAVWETESSVPFTLFALPDEQTRSNRFAIEIPFAASLILTHHADGEIRGLNEFEGVHPPVAPLFWAFRVMVGTGVLMILVSWWLGWSVFVRKGTPSLLQLRVTSLMTFAGWVAVLAGWYVTEIGRQPWLVYGELRVEDAVAAHGGGMVLSTLVLWLLLYAFVLASFVATVRYLAKKPSASLQASEQTYPGLLSGKEP